MRSLSNTLLAVVSLCTLAARAERPVTRSVNPAEYTSEYTSEGTKYSRDNDNTDIDPPPALQSALALEREKGDVSSDRRHIVARRVAGSPELDKREECGPGRWWNKVERECSYCPENTTKCQGRGGCCPSGTYCVKSKTGEMGCCPYGEQCEGAIPESNNRGQHSGGYDRLA